VSNRQSDPPGVRPIRRVLLVAPAGVGGLQRWCTRFAAALGGTRPAGPLDCGDSDAVPALPARAKAILRLPPSIAQPDAPGDRAPGSPIEATVLFEDDGHKQDVGPSPAVDGVRCETFVYDARDNKVAVCRRLERIIERFDCVYPNTSIMTYRALMAMGPRRPVIIGGCHGDNDYDYGLMTRFADVIDHYWPISRRCADGIRARLGGRDTPVRVIHYDVTPVPRWTPRPQGPLRIVFTGRFASVKRVEDVLAVAGGLMAAGIDFTLDLAGVGPLLDAMRQRAADHGLGDRVRFLGLLSEDAVRRLLADAHVLLLLSASEGYGLSALEAMAAGVVPIVTDVCGCTDTVVHGDNGFCAGVGDVPAVVDRIAALDADRTRLDALSRRAHESSQAFAPAAALAAHLAMIATAAQRRAASAPATRGGYDFAGRLDGPLVPNWLARTVRGLRGAAVTAPET